MIGMLTNNSLTHLMMDKVLTELCLFKVKKHYKKLNNLFYYFFNKMINVIIEYKGRIITVTATWHCCADYVIR